MNRISRTILIVDDCPEDREVYQRYLMCDPDYNFLMLEAKLGREGLELWQQHQPDAVLLDYQLPDLDGLEFLAQLQFLTHQPYLPLIMITGQGNEAIAVKAIKAGAQDYIVKEQITAEKLQIAVNGAIETVRLRNQLQQRIQRERVVTQITQKIYQLQNLDEILQTTVTEVREFLHSDRVLILQLKPNGEGTVVAESVGAQWRSLLSYTIYDPCLADNYLASNPSENIRCDRAFAENYIQRYRQGYVTTIFDTHNHRTDLDPCHIELLAQFQVKANLVVPILYDHHFWGLLIAHNCAFARRWQALEIDLLKELAIQVGIAIRQAELYQQAQSELTERRRVEAELRQSEQSLRLALSASRMGTWNWNIQTGKISWSDNLEALFGLQPGEFDGSFEMFVARLHPDDRDRLLASVDLAITTGKEHNIEFRVVYPDGTIRWSLSQGKVFYDQQGQPMHMAGINLDITERKRSAQALRQSEERFRQLAENINAVFWITEVPENRVSYVSPAYERLWGLNPQQLYQGQQAWTDRIHLEDRESTKRAFQEKATSGQFDQEYRIVLGDGSIRWVRDRCFPLQDETGKICRFTGIAEDITARKQTEIELQENRAKLQQQLAEIEAIYQTAPIGLNILDTDLRFVRINQRLAEMNGLPIEAHIGRTIRELLPDLADTAEEILYPIIQTGEPKLNVEIQGETPAQPGVPRIWLEHFLPLKDGDRVIGISTVCEEITERKQAELDLQERERQFATLAEASPTGIFRCDSANNCVYVNPRWCEITGQSAESALGMGWVQTVHPDDRDCITKAWLEWCANVKELGVFQIEGRCVRPDGCVIFYICQALPEITSEGLVVGYIGTLTDVSQAKREEVIRKEIEEALRQSEEHYRRLAELIPQLVWTANDAGTLLDVNQRWLEYTGLTLEQVATTGWERIVHPEDISVLTQKWNEAVQKGASYQAEGRIRRVDGLYRWHLHQAIPQKNEQGQIVKWFGTATDIEGQKQLEVERSKLLDLERTAREAAERANRTKDEFLAILSHELRSPLNPILGWTKLLQTRKFDETKTAEALAIIERNVKLQTQLIDDLLDVAKILRGKLSINAAPVDLVFIIESAIDTVITAATAKSILLHPVLSNIGQISGDASRLQQIVWNLLSNAIKFTPNGGRVEVRLEQVNGHAHIIVTDTGKGINPDFLPHIFESFRQEDISITRKYGGLGLGLAIVRQLVEAHGGTIVADSPGEDLGSTFTVEFPLLNVVPQTQQTYQLKQKILDLVGIRVLAVDDEPDARNLLKALLTQYGAEFRIVTSGAEVLEILESFRPDVLVSDIGMPDIDGYTLIQYIRALPPQKGGQTPAIALTAYARDDDSQRALNHGYQLHITKPLEPEILVQAVMQLKRINS